MKDSIITDLLNNMSKEALAIALEAANKRICELENNLPVKSERQIQNEIIEVIYKKLLEKQFCHDEYFEWAVSLSDIDDIIKSFGIDTEALKVQWGLV